MNKQEKEKIKEIISQYELLGTFCQNHIVYEDLTEELGFYGDYTVLLVKIENEVDETGELYYLFLDHKASVIIWTLDKDFRIINKIG